MADGDDPDLTREWALLQSLLSRAEEVADRIAPRLVERGIPPTTRRLSKPPAAPPRQRRFADPRFELLARPGVGALRIGPAGIRGVVTVSIDSAKPFELTPALTDLLAELAEGPVGEDGFPALRPYRHIAAALSARRGHQVGVRAVVVGISRLREKLLRFCKELSPLLVETVPGKGARFRIRRCVSYGHGSSLAVAPEQG